MYMILKGVLPVEDHEFQIVTQIQIFKLQYWKYLVGDVPDLPFPKRQHCIPPWIGKQATEIFSHLCLVSVSFHWVERGWEGNFPLSQWKGGILARWWLSSPQSLQQGWKNLPSFSRRHEQICQRGRSYDQSINLKGCVWGRFRGPNPQLFYPSHSIQVYILSFLGLPTEWTMPWV